MQMQLLPSSPGVTLTSFTTVLLPDKDLGTFFLIFAAKLTPVGNKNMVFERMSIESRGRRLWKGQEDTEGTLGHISRQIRLPQ